MNEDLVIKFLLYFTKSISTLIVYCGISNRYDYLNTTLLIAKQCKSSCTLHTHLLVYVIFLESRVQQMTNRDTRK